MDLTDDSSVNFWTSLFLFFLAKLLPFFKDEDIEELLKNHQKWQKFGKKMKKSPVQKVMDESSVKSIMDDSSVNRCR